MSNDWSTDYEIVSCWRNTGRCQMIGRLYKDSTTVKCLDSLELSKDWSLYSSPSALKMSSNDNIQTLTKDWSDDQQSDTGAELVTELYTMISRCYRQLNSLTVDKRLIIGRLSDFQSDCKRIGRLNGAVKGFVRCKRISHTTGNWSTVKRLVDCKMNRQSSNDWSSAVRIHRCKMIGQFGAKRLVDLCVNDRIMTDR